MKLIALATCVALLAGCSTATRFTDTPMQRYDADTKYAVDDLEDGFLVSVEYSKYQMIPETSVVVDSAKQAANAIAHEHAQKLGRKIRPIDQTRIKTSTGRAGVTGFTTCTVQLAADFE